MLAGIYWKMLLRSRFNFVSLNSTLPSNTPEASQLKRPLLAYFPLDPYFWLCVGLNSESAPACLYHFQIVDRTVSGTPSRTLRGSSWVVLSFTSQTLIIHIRARSESGFRSTLIRRLVPQTPPALSIGFLYAVAWTAVNRLGWKAKNASTMIILSSAPTPSPHQPCGGTTKCDAQLFLAFTGNKVYLGRRHASRSDSRESYLVMR